VALEPGVFVDPGSPAGKEYSVPLSVLREAGSGHQGVGDETEPLFGIGISPPRMSPHAGHAQKHGEGSRPVTQPTGSTGPTAPTPGVASGLRTAPPGGAASAESTALAELTHHGSAEPAMLLIGALVVLGGLALGAVILAARRRLG
jgi:hypothetical protein